MKIKIFLLSLLMFLSTLAAEDITGLWTSLNDAGKPQMIVAFYEYKGLYYGRIVASYNTKTGVIDDTMAKPLARANGVVGRPYLSGLDIIWGLKKEGSRYIDGTILDPTKGNEYDATAWIENNKLIVRGSLFGFGKKMYWIKTQEGDLTIPNYKKFIPHIPET